MPTEEEFAELQAKFDALNRHKKEADKMAADAQKKLREFEGVDVNEYQSLKTIQQELEAEKLKAAGEYEKLLNQQKENYEKEKAKLAAELETERQNQKKAKYDSDLATAYLKAGGKEETLEDFLILASARHLPMDEKTGTPILGDFKDLGDAVVSLRDSKMGYLFKPQGQASGTGENPPAGQPTAKITVSREMYESGQFDPTGKTLGVDYDYGF
jgi:hypothetical protein